MVARSFGTALALAIMLAMTAFLANCAHAADLFGGGCSTCNGGGGGGSGYSGAGGAWYSGGSTYGGGGMGSHSGGAWYGRGSKYSPDGCSSCGSTSRGCSSGCGSCGGGGCSSCEGRSACRSCASPEKVDCCDGCGGGRTVFGCGWRTWDFLGYWTCGRNCASCAGCGEIYRGDYASDPPACCDPCDKCGNWVGPSNSSLRSRSNPYYHSGSYYESSADYSYQNSYPHSTYSGEQYNSHSSGQVIHSAPRSGSAPSRLVPSSTRRPTTSVKSNTQARQTRTPLR